MKIPFGENGNNFLGFFYKASCKVFMLLLEQLPNDETFS